MARLAMPIMATKIKGAIQWTSGGPKEVQAKALDDAYTCFFVAIHDRVLYRCRTTIRREKRRVYVQPVSWLERVEHLASQYATERGCDE